MIDQNDIAQLVCEVQAGNRTALGKAITIVESCHPDHRSVAFELLELLPAPPPANIRLAISGAPGVGKSTFIDSLGQAIINAGSTAAVLAIDPSSPIAGGSILGDKTRMGSLSDHPGVFVRPTPARDQLGGVARHTRDVIALCEAAGYHNILIETVGVGQSEFEVRNMVDFFLLLIGPGAGDDLQGIKRGIVEIADGILINKTDGDQRQLAKQTKQFYAQAIRTFPLKEHGVTPFVRNTSASENLGVNEAWEAILDFNKKVQQSGYKQKIRARQAVQWFQTRAQEALREQLEQHPAFFEARSELETKVSQGSMTAAAASNELISIFNAMLDK